MIAAAGLTFLLLIGGASESQAPAGRLIGRPDTVEGVEALPRLTGDGRAARQFEHLTGALDDTGAAERTHCMAAAPERSQWSRRVTVPMSGPRFASLVIRDVASCGDTPPSATELRMTYDLATGDTIDWSSVLPPDLIEPRDQADTLDFVYEATVRSKALIAWHADQVLASMDAQTRANCEGRILDPSQTGGLRIWLDAERGGLAIAPALMGQGAAACAQSSIMPTEELRRRGAADELVDAIDAAHRDRGWAAHASELPL